MNCKYPRAEKLKHKTDISLLFEKGKWQTCGALRIIHYAEDSELRTCQKVGVSVSKRFFKRAVDRNRIKRMLREAYRLHKEDYVKKYGKNSLTMIFYISPKMPGHFSEIEKVFIQLIATDSQ